jgi:acetolactate synthase-1/2/3 large subunit
VNITGAEWIVERLEDHGIRVVAGVPGGAALPLYDALGRSTQIRHILARHEQGAAFIAHGIARSTGKPGVCLASSGPGATNLLTAIADAKLDSVPLIAITGQVPTALIGTDAFQEVDTIALARPITKATYFVGDAREIGDVFDAAFAAAINGRPGPVLIDVPRDVQLTRIQRSTRQGVSVRTHAQQNNDRAYDMAAAMIATSQKPLLYVGGGVVKAHAQTILRELSEREQIPVVTTLMALGVMPDGHPLNLHMLGMHGARYTNRAVHECDLLIAIGARFDDRATGRVADFAPAAREPGKIRRPDLGIVDDALTATRALLDRSRLRRRRSWLNRIQALRREYPMVRSAGSGADEAHRLIRALATAAGSDACVTTDVGQHQMWVAQSYPFERADRWLTSGGLGTMGFGLPAAIGAALAQPEITVLCFTGDGSLLMNIQELATLAELQLNVKIILFDNAALGLVHQQQQLFYAGALVASRYQRPSDFLTIARSFGVPAVDVNDVDDLRASLQQRGPLLLRKVIDANAHVMPMVAPGAANIDALDCEEQMTCDELHL